MTISSSLNAGVAGLNANATRLATISDNISNSSTYGYKRASADFASVVINGGSKSTYAAGGVRVSTMRLVDQRSSLLGTSNSTDIAISGRGFLPVTTISEVEAGAASLSLALTTTGSFRADPNGVLRTATGEVLLGWPANADGTIGTFPRDSSSGLQPVIIDTRSYVANPTSRVGLGVNLPATQTVAGAAGTVYDLSVEYFGNLGTAEELNVTFTPTVPATGAANEWTVTIADSASGGAVVGEYVVTFDASAAAGGRILSVTTISGGAYDPATGEATLTLGGGPITLSLGAPGQQGGLTQLSDSFAPTTVTKDGSPVGLQTGLEIDKSGNLYATYDQGFTRLVYRVPVIDVPNPNGLVALSNQTYRVSQDSGPMYLWDAGDGPTGSTEGFSREESATDVAGELTALIQTQRAYSSNAKVIQTVDEMLQETTNIKR